MLCCSTMALRSGLERKAYDCFYSCRKCDQRFLIDVLMLEQQNIFQDEGTSCLYAPITLNAIITQTILNDDNAARLYDTHSTFFQPVIIEQHQ